MRLVFTITLVAIATFIHPPSIDTANLTNASVLLGNARLSFIAGVTTVTHSGETSTITIDSSGNPDTSTANLFANDTVCIVANNGASCKGNKTYKVTKVENLSVTVSPKIQDTVTSSDLLVAAQTGSMKITFTTQTAIPANGDIIVTLPAIDKDGKTNDGTPDSNTNIQTNGFDLNRIKTSDIGVTGCTNANWSVAAITPGTATTDHIVRVDRRSTICDAGSTIAITIDTTPGIINPAPVTNRKKNNADIYTIGIKTRDADDGTLDSILTRVAPIEGMVTVGVSLGEGIAFTLSGVSADTGSYCGVTRTPSSPDTTASTIQWGTVNQPATFLQAIQQLNVSTNSTTGYYVALQENDQMGRSGVTCPGPHANYGQSCIQDTICNEASCDEKTAQDWSDETKYQGFGYSMQNINGVDAVFTFNERGSSFSAKQLPDKEANEQAETIMKNSGSVNSHDVAVCYRLAIPPAQPAGYYFNTVTYTAVPVF
ncbi:hypothetical protein HY358_01845 [Candidatus Roizmanbacteria bacterium]|nr:hypothetical protein [Candidatus Roizmanbacteria bacterium]